MKILAIALADEPQLYVRGYPPKGAWLFLRPDLEISRLAELAAGTDELVYQDQRVGVLEWNGKEDVSLVRVGFGQDEAARQTSAELRESGVAVVLFGPQVTAWKEEPPEWADCRVRGDILNAWPEIRADVRVRRLKPVYHSSSNPRHFRASIGFGRRPEMNTLHQVAEFYRGCACPEPVRRFCPEYLYYGDNTRVRTIEEAVGEVISMPGKHIQLLDEDVARDPDYYYRLFRVLWNYRRHWTVNASDRVFAHPELIRLLAKAGTKIIFLNETFLIGRLDEALRNQSLVKKLYRQVKYLQSRKLLVGARVLIRMIPGERLDAEKISSMLRRIDLDFAEIRYAVPDENGVDQLVPVAYRPMAAGPDPAMVKGRFYAIDAILDRVARRPRRTGFYTTVQYLLPYSLAYRQNYLEGLPFP